MSTTFIDPLPIAEPPANEPPTYDATPPATGGRIKHLVRGRPEDPTWVRPGLITLLTGTALLYIVGLGASGWANGFYAAAAQAGSTAPRSRVRALAIAGKASACSTKRALVAASVSTQRAPASSAIAWTRPACLA